MSHLVRAFAWVVLFCGLCSAQLDNASLFGTVSDPSGALIVAANLRSRISTLPTPSRPSPTQTGIISLPCCQWASIALLCRLRVSARRSPPWYCGRPIAFASM